MPTLLDRPEPDTRPVGRRRALAGPALVGAATVVGLVTVFRVDPADPGHYPLCPFRALTGLDCPGCGAMRGTHDLLHGDLVAALDHNLLLALAVPLALLSWLAWTRRAWTGRVQRVRVPNPLVYVGIALVVAFWVLRNLPGVPFLGSA